MPLDKADDFAAICSSDFKGLCKDNGEVCTLEVTMVTGLEKVAAEEIKEKLGIDGTIIRGRLFFDIESKRIHEVFKLRSIAHITVIIFMKEKFIVDENREDTFKRLFRLSELVDFRKGITVWQMLQSKNFGDVFQEEVELTEDFVAPKPSIDMKAVKKKSVLGNLPEEILSLIKGCENGISNTAENLTDDEKIPPVKTQRIGSSDLKFRASCHRSGEHHNFGAAEVARQFGGGVNSKFGWAVDLSNFDLEVTLLLSNEFTYVGIPLTRKPLYLRNLVCFGRTNLQSSVCFGMLRLLKPQAGDIVVDNMCGGGAIPLEGCFTHKDVFFYGGDVDKISLDRSRSNFDHHILNNTSLKADLCQWDTTRLPLRDQSVDLVVSDFPFGRRVGCRSDNRVLYYNTLLEMARVVKINSGKAALLTFDKNSMIKNMCSVNSLWKNYASKTINLGGLFACIYLFNRTSLLEDDTLKPMGYKPKRNYVSSDKPKYFYFYFNYYSKINAVFRAALYDAIAYPYR